MNLGNERNDISKIIIYRGRSSRLFLIIRLARNYPGIRSVLLCKVGGEGEEITRGREEGSGPIPSSISSFRATRQLYGGNVWQRVKSCWLFNIFEGVIRLSMEQVFINDNCTNMTKKKNMRKKEGSVSRCKIILIFNELKRAHLIAIYIYFLRFR